MARLSRQGTALPEIGALAEIPARSFVEWDRFLRSVYVYRGEIHEIIRTVEKMLDDWQTFGRIEGDCDDISVFNGAVLKRAGLEPQFVAIRLIGDDEFSHVYTIAQGFIFDPVVPVATAYPGVDEILAERI